MDKENRSAKIIDEKTDCVMDDRYAHPIFKY